MTTEISVNLLEILNTYLVRVRLTVHLNTTNLSAELILQLYKQENNSNLPKDSIFVKY